MKKRSSKALPEIIFLILFVDKFIITAKGKHIYPIVYFVERRAIENIKKLKKNSFL
jgi:hypothetical protein